MGEPYLTMAEIKTRYPDEWVLLDRPRLARGASEPLGGHVILHSRDRHEFDRGIASAPMSDWVAFWYTSRPDPDELPFLDLDL